MSHFEADIQVVICRCVRWTVFRGLHDMSTREYRHMTGRQGKQTHEVTQANVPPVGIRSKSHFKNLLILERLTPLIFGFHCRPMLGLGRFCYRVTIVLEELPGKQRELGDRAVFAEAPHCADTSDSPGCWQDFREGAFHTPRGVEEGALKGSRKGAETLPGAV